MDRRVRVIIELLNAGSQQQIRVPELARRVGIGASRLEHLFKAAVNMTIRDFVREHRLRKAAQLLGTSHERISTIGQRVGFADISNFNHAFKRHFGLTPRAYRQRMHEEISRSDQQTAEATNE